MQLGDEKSPASSGTTCWPGLTISTPRDAFPGHQRLLFPWCYPSAVSPLLVPRIITVPRAFPTLHNAYRWNGHGTFAVLLNYLEIMV